MLHLYDYALGIAGLVGSFLVATEALLSLDLRNRTRGRGRDRLNLSTLDGLQK